MTPVTEPAGMGKERDQGGWDTSGAPGDWQIDELVPYENKQSIPISPCIRCGLWIPRYAAGHSLLPGQRAGLDI